jgi:hypothetical protein
MCTIRLYYDLFLLGVMIEFESNPVCVRLINMSQPLLQLGDDLTACLNGSEATSLPDGSVVAF